MLAKNHSDPELKRKIPTDIVEIIDGFQKALIPHGVHFQGHNRISLNKYYASPKPVQDAIAKALLHSSNLVATVIDLNHAETEMLVKACADVNLEVPEDFIRSIRRGDIIEVYETETMIQIYRNNEFLKHCSYDLLTVCLTPIYELFERESGFDDKILDRSKFVTHHETRAVSWNVDDHELVERLESHNRIFKMKMGTVAPVKHKVSGKPMAWASTLKVERIGSMHDYSGNVTSLK